MGTPAYISPEQAQGQPVDQRSDIYSLGIILYEMVIGSVPFVADTPLAVLFKHITDPLPLPSKVKSDVPEQIEKVILKALAKNPQDRFATASDFVEAWKSALEQARAARTMRDTVTPENRAPETVVKRVEPKPVVSQKVEKRSGAPLGWAAGCIAVVCLLLAVAGIGALALGGKNLTLFAGASATPQPTNTAVPVSNTEALLSDDFSVSRDGWGTLTDSDSSVEYEKQALRMKLFQKNYVIWSRPNDENYENVHVEVQAINNDTDSTTAFGIMCFQVEDWSFYYLAMTPAGEYAIIKATTDEDDVVLTNNGKWASSDSIKHNAASYHIGADCAGGTLTLYVDGKKIASAKDSTYSSGHIGLFAWSGENVSSGDVSFDDFVLTSVE
jgi:serine/threonine protein kinase